ncbi:NADH-quinone oxidoreductase subunit N [Cohnella pontilimi]|uniref:NADH-quinone oxidoreductase subunit N n=1 Tax=Cohnella pontilimi TaxID=2564100 RepID=A0A4V5LS64_9BACL|nr:NADH-quinone oxidoreductase subunit N [Cohnella pontilimi]TJY41909.1 NADH-quinone oxidoreductase subunit N [Cohnella pontilimi]
MEQIATLTWSDAWYLAPEITLSAFAVVLALLDLFAPKSWNRNFVGWLAIVGLAAAAGFVAWLMLDFQHAGDNPQVHELLGGSYRVDDFGNLLKLLFLGSSAFIVLASLGSVRTADVPIKGEFYYLMLPAALGAMVMASSGDLITLFVGLELLSITTYILVGSRKRSGVSSEAAFKYLVTGGVASAFILYGMSFLYGIAGTTNVGLIREHLGPMVTDYRALMYVSFFLMIAGFAMKVALAPFHAWAADVYQGAPTPVTSFLAVVSKGAAFAMLYRIFMNIVIFIQDDPRVHDDLYLALAVPAAAAMIVGTAGALRQQNLKRLLALSGVANAGILMIPLALQVTLLHASAFSEFFYYLLAYAFMNIGAFAVLTVVSRHSGNESLSAFAGLYHRAPWTAAAMTVLLCSLAGLPVTGGFFGKLFILFGTVQTRAYWLAAILLVTTVVSYAVYFGIIRQMYLRSGDEDGGLRIPGPAAAAIWISVAATLALGFFPKPVLGWIDSFFAVRVDFWVS